MAGEVTIKGLRELNRALARTDKEAAKQVKDAFREVAEPIRNTAEELAAARIRRIGPRWSRMRIGVTSKSVYIAPRQRGGKRGPQRRPNLGTLLMEQAMLPALEKHESDVERRVEKALDELERIFEKD